MLGNKFKQILGGTVIGLILLMIFGLLWAFVGNQGTAGLTSGGFGWYLFSYAMGLTMIVLPCTLPLAFVIVPMVLKKGAAKGFGLALSFGLGVAITLSLYGLAAAVIGKTAITGLQAPLELVKNWVYFIAGIFAYLFALGEIGLVKFRMPSYTGAAPAFIQKQGDYLKALLLGLFLGNIGVGCPHPATPLILTEIASSGDLFYGWSLFLVHAIGRIIPLLILAFLAILGVNALSWLVSKKDKLERATGWAMVFVAGFILTLGLFTHDWWVNSGQHTLLESLTQEEFLTERIANQLGVGNSHAHGLEEGIGLFGLPLNWGNWFLVFLWVLPLWWYYKMKKKEVMDKTLLRWRFWTYLAITLFLISTFVFYLPTRFLLQAQMPHDEMMMEDGMMMAHDDDHGESVYHEESAVAAGLAVNFSLGSSPPAVGQPTEMRFFVNDRPSGAPVPNYVLEIEHEKLMHVIGVRDDLEQFFHVHPQPMTAPGVFTVNHIFRAPGDYKVWSEIKQGGTIHAFGHAPFGVSGAASDIEKPQPKDFFRRIIIDGDNFSYDVSLNLNEPVIASHDHDLSFSILESDGRSAILDNYLGAQMHLAVIKDDRSQFLHVHPEDDAHTHAAAPFEFVSRALANGGGHESRESTVVAGQGSVNFHVNFQTPGLYRAFAQFRPASINLAADEYLLAAFWIEVKDAAQIGGVSVTEGSRTLAGTGSGVWWVRLVVSLITIVILSLLIKRLIKV
ncbi:MAG: hypothetical protein HYT47_02355 [Candidatus Vogelbacteria bacterium]|nr:hypothetical protein [Candidatus Vogelbacteria bacterium]